MTTISKTMITRALGLKLTEQFSRSGFSRKNKRTLVWYRHNGEICHVISMGKLKSNNFRVACMVASRESGSVAIGGNLTHSSIHLGEHLGGDYFWTINTDEDLKTALREIQLAFLEVAEPWFSAISTHQELSLILDKYLAADRYAVKGTEYFNLPKTEWDNHLRFVDELEFRTWAGDEICRALNSLGFDSLDDEYRTQIRIRGDVTDVLMLRLINNGLHFGAQAVNWIPELSASGDGKLNVELLPLLNGGPVSETNKETGDAFLLGREEIAENSVKNFVRVIRSITEPNFRKIDSKMAFMKSVHRNMLPLARAMLKLNNAMDLYELSDF